MLLIGMFDSPYVRRVAITLKLLEIPFDHGNWSVGADFDRIREYSPLGDGVHSGSSPGERKGRHARPGKTRNERLIDRT